MNEITKAEMRQKLGNISQLQDLLFGEQIEQYDRKLTEHARKISQIELKQTEFQLAVKKRLEKLEIQLTHKLDTINNTLEKKLKYIEVSTKEEQAKIQQDLNTISQYSYENIDFLQNNLNTQTNNLKTEIAQSKVAIDRDLQLLKQQVTDKLQTSLAKLSTGKVSRNDLADLLFELCLKVKEPDTNLELPQGIDNGNIVDLVLPEQ